MATRLEGPATWSILVHGGAGDVLPERIPLHVAGCERAAQIGADILAAGGSALDAVEAAVCALEDDPLFNAGTGACLDEDGHIRHDAAIMNGEKLETGAICAAPPFENPIRVARAVMEKSPHVLLAGEGAARFAEAHGFTRANEADMITDRARASLEAARAKNAVVNTAGTVGAVARDANGHVAAATSTGGMVNKLAGRVGDSPIVGAGTYADDDTGACSTTGHGEAMIRICAAKRTLDQLDKMRNAPDEAARLTLEHMKAKTGSTGGIIVAARDGSLGLARTTRTMSWALVSDGRRISGS